MKPDEGLPQDDHPAPQGQGLVPGGERDLAVLTAHAVSAFRDVGGAYRTGHLTHDVEVADGVIEVTPYHVDEHDRRIQGGELALRTGAITADSTSLLGDRTTSLANGVVEVDHGMVVETIKNREDGVEQAWRFDVAPPSTGDLTVTVAVMGQDFVAMNDNGLHFRSPDGLGFRYSHALWVEADGTEWPIQARFAEGHIVMTVPASVLENTTYPAVLDPTITAEVAVDAPVNGGTGATSQNASIAFDGTNYLVVWQDRRLSTDPDIFGTRLSAAGAILDARGIAIATGPGVQSNPTVAFAGGSFVVAWEDFKVAGGTEADIDAARVSTAGVVTALPAVAATGANETGPILGSNGTAALLAWNVADTDVAGARFDGTGFTSIGSIAATAAIEQQPAVAGAPGGDFLVAWSEGPSTSADIRGSIVTAAGSVGAAFDISNGAARQFAPAASHDGTNFVVAWATNLNGLNIFGSRVTAAGATLDTHLEGTATFGGASISSAAGSQEQPAIGCNSGVCLVTWRDQRNINVTNNDIFAQLVTSNATTFALAGGELTLSAELQAQQNPAVGASGAGFFVAWNDRRDVLQDALFGSTVSNAGAVGTASRFVTGNNRENSPSVGRAGGVNFVAWTDSRTGSADINFVRFTAQSKNDVTARTASSQANSQSSPSVSSSNGTSAYAVWSDTRSGTSADIFGTKLNSDGTVTSAAGIPITQAAGDQLVPQVSSNPTGTGALVVWQDRRNNNFDIFGAVLDAAGNVVASDIVICNATADQTRPTVAFDPGNGQWVVVWSDARVAGNTDVFAARVNSAGTVLDPNGVNITNTAGGQFSPVIAFTGTEFFAAWEDRRNDGNGDIFGGRLRAGASLQILDGSGIGYGGTAGAQTHPAVASTGGAFILAWQDNRNQGTTGSDIFGIGVASTGAVSEPEFVISAAPENETTPVIGETSTQLVTRIAYAKERPDLQTIRVASRQITSGGASGNTCTTDAQCGAGGFCRDGVCCESDCGGAANSGMCGGALNCERDCQACRSTLTGQPNGVCAPIVAGRVCRTYKDTFCDSEEKCDGTNTACPEDLGRRQGLACSIAGGGTGVCPPNSAAGAPHVCQ